MEPIIENDLENNAPNYPLVQRKTVRIKIDNESTSECNDRMTSQGSPRTPKPNKYPKGTNKT